MPPEKFHSPQLIQNNRTLTLDIIARRVFVICRHYHQIVMKNFTASQITVLQALAMGMPLTAAAEHASVPRLTVYSWFEDPSFMQAFAMAHQESALIVHDRVQSLTTKALDAIESILNNPKASPSVLLRAALALLTRKNWALPTLSAPAAPMPDQHSPAAEMDAIEEDEAHSPAHPHATPRNAPCPCGSGQKFKRCCGRNAPPVLHGTPDTHASRPAI